MQWRRVSIKKSVGVKLFWGSRITQVERSRKLFKYATLFINPFVSFLVRDEPQLVVHFINEEPYISTAVRIRKNCGRQRCAWVSPRPRVRK